MDVAMYLFKRTNINYITVCPGMFTNKQLKGRFFSRGQTDEILEDIKKLSKRYRASMVHLHHDLEDAGGDMRCFRDTIDLCSDLFRQFEEIIGYGLNDLLVFVSENHGKEYIFAPGYDYRRLIIKSERPNGQVSLRLYDDVFHVENIAADKRFSFDIRDIHYAVDMPYDFTLIYNWLAKGILP